MIYYPLLCIEVLALICHFSLSFVQKLELLNFPQNIWLTDEYYCKLIKNVNTVNTGYNTYNISFTQNKFLSHECGFIPPFPYLSLLNQNPLINHVVSPKLAGQIHFFSNSFFIIIWLNFASGFHSNEFFFFIVHRHYELNYPEIAKYPSTSNDSFEGDGLYSSSCDGFHVCCSWGYIVVINMNWSLITLDPWPLTTFKVFCWSKIIC